MFKYLQKSILFRDVSRNYAALRVIPARQKNGFPENPNAYGPLTDLPDYTFLDGRRTPPGPCKVMRARKQRDITARILQLSSEVDFAVERRERLKREEQEGKQQILRSKLKAKWGNSPTRTNNNYSTKLEPE